MFLKNSRQHSRIVFKDADISNLHHSLCHTCAVSLSCVSSYAGSVSSAWDKPCHTQGRGTQTPLVPAKHKQYWVNTSTKMKKKIVKSTSENFLITFQKTTKTLIYSYAGFLWL